MEGTQLEPWHTIFISVQDISPSQRELLWNVYKPNDLFDDFILRLPKNKKWDRDGGNWIISFNPEHVEPEELFRRWETAYKEALEIVLANDGEEQ
jgi:hypothetical protein